MSNNKDIMNRLYPPHHTELPEGIIDDFLATEECLLAQLRWAYKRYMEVVDDREAYERYEKINKQCQGRDYGFATMNKAFKDIGLDFATEQEKHLRYWIPHNRYLAADKAYKDFRCCLSSSQITPIS